MKQYKFTDIELANMIAMYNNGIKISKIAYSYNCSHTVIRKRLKEAKVIFRKTDRKQFKCNDNYFDLIDSKQKAYWLGFIMADGNLTSSKQKVLTICLSNRESDHLDKFLKELEANHKIYNYNYKTPVSVIRIDSKKIHSDLIKLGCPPKKTHTIKYPNIEQIFDSAFILGYLDGDGCICNSPKNKQIVFLGTKELLESISKKLPFDHKVNISEYRGIYRLGIRLNKERAIKLYNYLYSNPIYSLNRKKEILKLILQELA